LANFLQDFGMSMIVRHEGASEDEVLSAAMLHKR